MDRLRHGDVPSAGGGVWPGLDPEDLVDDEEVALAVALTASGVASPKVGIENQPSGVMLTFAWQEGCLATIVGPEAVDEVCELDGWTVLPPDAEQIVTALMPSTPGE